MADATFYYHFWLEFKRSRTAFKDVVLSIKSIGGGDYLTVSAGFNGYNYYVLFSYRGIYESFILSKYSYDGTEDSLNDLLSHENRFYRFLLIDEHHENDEGVAIHDNIFLLLDDEQYNKKTLIGLKSLDPTTFFLELYPSENVTINSLVTGYLAGRNLYQNGYIGLQNNQLIDSIKDQFNISNFLSNISLKSNITENKELILRANIFEPATKVLLDWSLFGLAKTKIKSNLIKLNALLSALLIRIPQFEYIKRNLPNELELVTIYYPLINSFTYYCAQQQNSTINRYGTAPLYLDTPSSNVFDGIIKNKEPFNGDGFELLGTVRPSSTYRYSTAKFKAVSIRIDFDAIDDYTTYYFMYAGSEDFIKIIQNGSRIKPVEAIMRVSEGYDYVDFDIVEGKTYKVTLANTSYLNEEAVIVFNNSLQRLGSPSYKNFRFFENYESIEFGSQNSITESDFGFGEIIIASIYDDITYPVTSGISERVALALNVSHAVYLTANIKHGVSSKFSSIIVFPYLNARTSFKAHISVYGKLTAINAYPAINLKINGLIKLFSNLSAFISNYIEFNSILTDKVIHNRTYPYSIPEYEQYLLSIGNPAPLAHSGIGLFTSNKKYNRLAYLDSVKRGIPAYFGADYSYTVSESFMYYTFSLTNPITSDYIVTCAITELKERTGFRVFKIDGLSLIYDGDNNFNVVVSTSSRYFSFNFNDILHILLVRTGADFNLYFNGTHVFYSGNATDLTFSEFYLSNKYNLSAFGVLESNGSVDYSSMAFNEPCDIFSKKYAFSGISANLVLAYAKLKRVIVDSHRKAKISYSIKDTRKVQSSIKSTSLIKGVDAFISCDLYELNAPTTKIRAITSPTFGFNLHIKASLFERDKPILYLGAAIVRERVVISGLMSFVYTAVSNKLKAVISPVEVHYMEILKNDFADCFRGDTLQLIIKTDIPDLNGYTVYLTVKRYLSDPDAAAIYQGSYTVNQSTDTIDISMPPSASKNLIPDTVFYADVQVVNSTGDIVKTIYYTKFKPKADVTLSP